MHHILIHNDAFNDSIGSMTHAADKNGMGIVNFKPKDGESIFELQKRVINFFNMLKRKYKGKTVLLVSHGGPITQLLLHILKVPGKEYKKYHPKNTAVSVLEFKVRNKKFVPKLIKLNCTKHLD